jgi:pimeloyl-ACP methyl ester carboxylesterase
MGRILLLVFSCMLVPAAIASDYEREKRWADEVVPGLVVGDAVYLKAATGKDFLALYTEAKDAKAALVIVHGVGVHPDHGVIGSLRVKLADAGYSTLSIQMPIAGAVAKNEDYYPVLFPDAVDRIGVAAKYLRDKGYSKIVLVSHSMGSWMSNVYLNETSDIPYAVWVCMGLTGGYTTRVMGIQLPMLSVKIPILDVYGENDLPPVLKAASRRAAAIGDVPGSKQVRIDAADHFYNSRENELASAIAAYLDERFSAGKAR